MTSIWGARPTRAAISLSRRVAILVTTLFWVGSLGAASPGATGRWKGFLRFVPEGCYLQTEGADRANPYSLDTRFCAGAHSLQNGYLEVEGIRIPCASRQGSSDRCLAVTDAQLTLYDPLAPPAK